ncbi:MAG: DUF1360 domain-containing protein [Fibrobacterota bacterium]|nr:DUF1360 domain-containing protein [Fibrobacterota bacterium]
MDHRKLFGWLTLDLIIFLVVNVFLIARFRDTLAGLAGIGPLHFMVLGLAVYRSSNIVSNEVVTKPLRAPFVEEVEKDGKLVEEPKKTGFMGATGLLIYCPSCTGVWLSAALVYAYAFWPGITFAIALFLALSAIERIIAGVLGCFKRNS